MPSRKMVTTQTLFPTSSTTATEKRPTELTLLISRERWLVLLFLSSALGLVSGIFGLGLAALSALDFLQIQSGGSVSTILCVAAFPLLILAAHCFDKIRETEKKAKLERCRRLGTHQSYIEN